MNSKIFDTHAHYDHEAFDLDRDLILGSLSENGVEAVVNVGASIQSTKNTLQLVKGSYKRRKNRCSWRNRAGLLLE